MCPRNSLIPSLITAAALAIGTAACGSDSATTSTTGEPVVTESAASLSITDAWSRQPAEGQMKTAVYGVVSNTTDADITLVSASTSVTSNVELHETLVADDGTMSMQEVEAGFVVPAGATFTFEPGGPHVMLLDIDPATYPTDSVDMILVGDGGETLAFEAEVRELAADEGEMEDMEGSDQTEEMPVTTDG
jgi:copper(I)-binding protein